MSFFTSTLARILYALPFAVFGINHFRFAGSMKAIVPSFIPSSMRLYLVYFTGVAMIAASAAIITKVQGRLACFLLALMLGLFVATIHAPLLLRGDNSALVSLLKDTSLAAAALFIGGNLKK